MRNEHWTWTIKREVASRSRKESFVLLRDEVEQGRHDNMGDVVVALVKCCAPQMVLNSQ